MRQKCTPQGSDCLSGKVDDLVFYVRLGVPYAKKASMNPGKSIAKNPDREIFQARLRYLVSLYQALAGTRARESWRTTRLRPGQTGYNAFVSRNYAAFNAKEAVADHARLTLSDGRLRHPLGLGARVRGEREIAFEWKTQDDQLLGAQSDRPRVILMPDDGSYGIIARESLEAKRKDGRVVVTLSPEEGRPPFAYLYWESRDGRRFSPTQFLLIAWDGGGEP